MEKICRKSRSLILVFIDTVSRFLNYNGHILPVEEKLFHADNRAFRYGDGLFESIRLIKGKIMFPELHAERLKKGIQLLKMEGAQKITAEFIENDIYDLARRNKIFTDARARITVFRSDGGFYTPVKNAFSYLIELDKLETKGFEWNTSGISICLYDEIPKSIDPLSNFKTCNSLLFVLASVYKSKMKTDEAILLNSNGHLVEAGNSNIFLVKDEEIYTPSLQDGCIGGVMRTVVLGLAEKLKMKVNQGKLKPTLLQSANEIFLTNASQGIRWVVSYGTKRYYTRVSKLLNVELNKLVLSS